MFNGGIIIAISAKIGCGKTAVANLLVKNFGFTRMGFGDIVKEEVSQYFQIPIDTFYDSVRKEIPTQTSLGLQVPRRLLQWWGTDFRRKEDPDYWVKQLALKLDTYVYFQEAHGKDALVVIDDARFINEMDFVENRGGLRVRLEPYDGYQANYLSHVSETELDNYTKFDVRYFPGFGQLANVAINIGGLVGLVG